ncbi:hypothetical protein WA026_019853 [Henosepilachna vigintioctopunctata]
MAETVKKSRIVSDDNLEETLMEEFNLRLKSCLSQDHLEPDSSYQQNEEILYENIESVRNNTELFSTKTISSTFIETEIREEIRNKSPPLIENDRQNISNGHERTENIYQNLENISKPTSDYVDMQMNAEGVNGSPVEDVDAIYEDLCPDDQTERLVQSEETCQATNKPSFKLLSAASLDAPEKMDVKSAKDRMLLSSDDTSTLLFTQTVTSPMLTPSEENVDFLKGFRQQTSPDSSPKEVSQSDDSSRTNGVEENADFNKQESEEIEKLKQDFEEPRAEKYLDQTENLYENLETMDESIYENVESLRKAPATECFNKLDGSFGTSTCADDSEPVSESVPEIVSQIEQRKTSEFGDDDDVTEISDVCSLDKQVSDSDSSNMLLDNWRADEPRNPDKFGVVQDFIEKVEFENADGVDCDDIEMNGTRFEANQECFESQNVGYNNAEVIEYIAMTEEPKNRPIVLESDNLTQMKDYPEDESDTHSDIPTRPDERGDHKEESIEDSEQELTSLTQTRIVDEIVKNYDTSKMDTSLKNREKDTETVPPKIVQNLTSQFMKNGDDKDDISTKNKKHETTYLKSVDIMKQINKFEQKEDVLCDKSSFSKFDALQKKNVLHVRSSDSSKAQEKFNGTTIDTTNCKSCGKQVFQMEQIKAEKAIWHKNCFRCQECSKQLNVDTYESHEGTLYCKPHFKALFAPKAVDDTDEPPSDKPDLGLEELQSLNVKERFQVFEQHQSSDSTLEKAQVNVKRSPSILSKLARFQAKGMDIGVADDSLNGIPIEESSSEGEEEEEDIPDGEDPDLVRAKRVQKEKPFHFSGMSDVKNKWEHGEPNSKDERREERKQEIQSIRNKLFMGKQGRMKEAYQEAVMKSETSVTSKIEEIKACDTKTIKERFETGKLVQETTRGGREEDDQEVFESEISKQSRSLFLQLDANASKAPQISPVSPPKLENKKAREAYIQKSSSQDTVKCSEYIDEVTVQTADIQQRFKFFETYREPEKQRKTFRITPPREGQVKGSTPEREMYHDPNIVRSEEVSEDSVIAKETHTATKMLNKFRQMEENLTKESAPLGPKPLKSFTPPPEPPREESSTEDGSESEEEELDEFDHTKVPDEDLIEAQKAARAKQLRAKFEKWEAQEIKREQNNSSINIMEEYGEEQSQIESTKLLRARFESMRESQTEVNKPRTKVNRFV